VPTPAPRWAAALSDRQRRGVLEAGAARSPPERGRGSAPMHASTDRTTERGVLSLERDDPHRLPRPCRLWPSARCSRSRSRTPATLSGTTEPNRRTAPARAAHTRRIYPRNRRWMSSSSSIVNRRAIGSSSHSPAYLQIARYRVAFMTAHDAGPVLRRLVLVLVLERPFSGSGCHHSCASRFRPYMASAVLRVSSRGAVFVRRVGGDGRRGPPVSSRLRL